MIQTQVLRRPLTATLVFAVTIGTAVACGGSDDSPRSFNGGGSGGSDGGSAGSDGGSAGSDGGSAGSSAGSGGSTGGSGGSTGGSGGSVGGSGGSTGGSAGSGGATGGSGGSTGGSGGSGGCAGSLTDCGGTCVDLQTDASNCGECARSCGTTSCIAGACEPLTLDLDTSGRDLDISSTHVYYAMKPSGMGGLVKRIPVGGGTAQTLYSDEGEISSVLVDSDLYWSGSKGERKAALTGGAFTSLDSKWGRNLSQNATQLVYVFHKIISLSDLDYEIYTVPKSGGTPKLIYVEPDRSPGRSLSVSGSDVFWTRSAFGDWGGIQKKSLTSILSTTPPTEIYSSESKPGHLQLVGGKLYWTTTDGTDTTLRSGTLDGNTATTVTTFQATTSVSNLLVRGDGIIWSEDVGGVRVIRAADADGSNQRTLSTDVGGTSIVDLEADADRVYYLLAGGVFSVPR